MNRKILITAAISAIIAIILGAFGAHKLKELLTVESLTAFETGVRYQMYHTFLLLFLGIIGHLSDKQKKIVYMLTVFGMLFFSGSIYILSTKSVTGIDFSTFAIITPIGGMLFILAWAFLLRFFLKFKSLS